MTTGAVTTTGDDRRRKTAKSSERQCGTGPDEDGGDRRGGLRLPWTFVLSSARPLAALRCVALARRGGGVGWCGRVQISGAGYEVLRMQVRGERPQFVTVVV